MESQKAKPKKVRVRGVGSFDLTDNTFGFRPYSEAPSSQQNVKTCAGGGKRWVTIGSNPSKVITLKCKESSADQYADFLNQFNALTRDLKPKKPVTLPDNLRVVKEDNLECWVDVEKNGMTFTGSVDLSKHPRDWQAELLRLVQLVVRRLPASERFTKLIDHIKKAGGQSHV